MDDTYIETVGAVDYEDDGDDSGYSSYEDVSLLTRSVHSSIFAYLYVHGRRYHASTSGDMDYFSPDDEPEQFRINMQHRCMFLSAGSKLYHAPLESPIRVLDIGTGTGIWALEMAEKYPQTEIYGVDFSPIQPQWAPENVKFEIDDVENRWTWPENHFDLIYSKTMLVGVIQDLPKYFEQAFRHCAPDGYFECVEMTIPVQSDHYKIPEDNAILRWTKLLNSGIKQMGRTLEVDADKIVSLMQDVGFVDVTVKPFKVPIGTWPKDPTLKQAGSVQLVALLEGLEGLSLGVFTHCLGWSVEDTKAFIEQVKHEYTRKKSCYYGPAVIVYGRKPFPEEPASQYATEVE